MTGLPATHPADPTLDHLIEGGATPRERHRSSDPEAHVEPWRLDPADVDAIARRVVELLTGPLAPAASAPKLIDATEVARRLGRTAVWVRRHADELGAVRLGDGDRPRLAFSPERIAEYLAARSAGNDSPPSEAAAPAAQPRRHRQRGAGTAIGSVPFEGSGVPPWR